MDLCCVCMVNQRDKDFRGLCSYQCLIKYAATQVGECLIQNKTIYYKDKKYQKIQARKYIYEELIGSIPAGLVIILTCRQKHCINIDHMKLIPINDRARNRRLERREREKERKARIERLKLTYCNYQFCGKEISMIERLHPYCDDICEFKEIVSHKISRLHYNFVYVFQTVEELKSVVKKECEEIIKLISS